MALADFIELLDTGPQLFLIVVARREQITFAIGVVGPVIDLVVSQTVAGVAIITNVYTPVFPIFVHLLAIVVPVASIAVGGHGRDEIKATIIQKVNKYRGVCSLVKVFFRGGFLEGGLSQPKEHEEGKIWSSSIPSVSHTSIWVPLNSPVLQDCTKSSVFILDPGV